MFWEVLAREAQRLGAVDAKAAPKPPAAWHAVAGVRLDLARQPLDEMAVENLAAAADADGLSRWLTAMDAGELVNVTEGRAVRHHRLRLGDDRLRKDGIDADIAALRKRLRDIDLRCRNGKLCGANGDVISDVVHIGIGGSELGPHLVYDALASRHRIGPRLHFVANLDRHRSAELMQVLDPNTTLVIVVSKSFGTLETKANGEWFADWLGGRRVLAGQLQAVTANTSAARDWGIPDDAIWPMWDCIGGRFSLWSAVGLSLVISLGWSVFSELLAGAAEADDTVFGESLGESPAFLMALIDVWHRNVSACNQRAVVPYDERLRQLPAWLQQLEMESNGKRVGRNGELLEHATSPAVWGAVGSNAQHAFFQALHQGTEPVPVEFVGVVHPDHPFLQQHQQLNANLIAQSAALQRGTGRGESFRHCPGGRASSIVWIDRLTPRSLGTLLALYECKTELAGWLWGVNSFDQYAVELGKRLARGAESMLWSGADADELDEISRRTLAWLRSRYSEL